MRTLKKTFLLSLVLGFLCPPRCGFSQPPLHVALDHWAYPLLDRFEAKRWIRLPTTTRPLTRGEIAEALQPLMEKVARREFPVSAADAYAIDKLEAEFLTPPEHRVDHPVFRLTEPDRMILFDARTRETLDLSRQSLPVSTADVHLEAQGGIRNTLAVEERLSFKWRKLGKEDFFDRGHETGRTWHGAEAEIRRANLRAVLPWFGLELGREPLWWGTGRQGTLLLSDNGMPLDFLGLVVSFGPARFEAVDAVLSSQRGRFFSGHRLSAILPVGLTLAVSEVVVYSGERPEPGYLNPLIPFYATQWNRREDDNILWSMDCSWLAARGTKLYGEVLIDDFMYNRKPPAPNKVGLLLGFHAADPLGLSDTDWKVEYARLDKWVYTHREALNAYVDDQREALGDRLGPDADLLSLRIEHRLTPRLEGSLSLSQERHGEGRDTAVPWLEGEDPRTLFLSGIVEKNLTLSLRFKQEWSWRFSSFIEGSASRTVNKDNQPGADESRQSLGLGVSFDL